MIRKTRNKLSLLTQQLVALTVQKEPFAGKFHVSFTLVLGIVLKGGEYSTIHANRPHAMNISSGL